MLNKPYQSLVIFRDWKYILLTMHLTVCRSDNRSVTASLIAKSAGLPYSAQVVKNLLTAPADKDGQGLIWKISHDQDSYAHRPVPSGMWLEFGVARSPVT